MLDQQKSQKSNFKNWKSDLSVHGIGKEKGKPVFKKQPSNHVEKHLPAKTLNCRFCGTKHGVRAVPQLPKAISFPDHEQHCCYPDLFVGVITTGAHIKKGECFVMLPV